MAFCSRSWASRYFRPCGRPRLARASKDPQGFEESEGPRLLFATYLPRREQGRFRRRPRILVTYHSPGVFRKSRARTMEIISVKKNLRESLHRRDVGFHLQKRCATIRKVAVLTASDVFRGTSSRKVRTDLPKAILRYRYLREPRPSAFAGGDGRRPGRGRLSIFYSTFLQRGFGPDLPGKSACRNLPVVFTLDPCRRGSAPMARTHHGCFGHPVYAIVPEYGPRWLRARTKPTSNRCSNGPLKQKRSQCRSRLPASQLRYDHSHSCPQSNSVKAEVWLREGEDGLLHRVRHECEHLPSRGRQAVGRRPSRWA